VKKRWIVLPPLLIASGITAWAAFNSDLHDPYPPLVADLPTRTWKQVSDALSNRIATHFPVGSPEQSLILELQREGFRRRGSCFRWGKSPVIKTATNSNCPDFPAECNGAFAGTRTPMAACREPPAKLAEYVFSL
jgi:hypothetical protein